MCNLTTHNITLPTLTNLTQHTLPYLTQPTLLNLTLPDLTKPTLTPAVINEVDEYSFDESTGRRKYVPPYLSTLQTTTLYVTSD
jgi:hypothetical protein